MDAGRFVDVLDLDMILRPVRRQSICYTSAIKTLLDALLKHLIHTDLIWTFICHSPPNIQDQPYNNGLMSSQPGLVWRVQGISGDTNRDFLQSILGNLGILLCIPGWIEITMILPEQHSAHFLTVEVVLQNSCVTQNLGIKLSGPFDQTFLPFVWAQQISHLNKTTGVPQSQCKRMIEIFVIIWLELNLIWANHGCIGLQRYSWSTKKISMEYPPLVALLFSIELNKTPKHFTWFVVLVYPRILAGTMIF